jgi:hypothetical protein
MQHSASLRACHQQHQSATVQPAVNGYHTPLHCNMYCLQRPADVLPYLMQGMTWVSTGSCQQTTGREERGKHGPNAKYTLPHSPSKAVRTPHTLYTAKELHFTYE